MSTPATAARPAGAKAGDIRLEFSVKFPEFGYSYQESQDGIPTVWVQPGRLKEVLRWLKAEVARPYRMLFDLTAIDERLRVNRQGQPESDFTVVYHLMSFDRNADFRVKVALKGEFPSLPSVCDVFVNANWYEREVWDLFGIKFDGHPNLARIMMPRSWVGHPLRKDHPARGTEFERFHMDELKADRLQEDLKIDPAEWGFQTHGKDHDFMLLNLGPNHPSVHGVFRIMLQLDGEEIIHSVPDIGYHHRGAEKMGERQSWHSYIPYTDRIDYLGGVMNNLPYLMAIEKMAGIEVPPRAQCIRVMLCEFFRIMSHLLFYGTYVQDVGSMSPVFFMFVDRQKAYDVVEAITGFRMHPAWFRIGGVAADLPNGWDRLVREFLDFMPKRLDDYFAIAMKNSILIKRSKHVAAYTTDEAIDWGVTGAGLRATGMPFDLRKARPYSGYENYEFEIPTGKNGDVLDRALVRIEEIKQSLRIIEQCLKNMPAGDYKARHPLTTPPIKDNTMQDIETLIHHFLSVSWGPVIPPGECAVAIEATKGLNGYYLVSDGSTMSYRTRIRTPSFPHLQQIPTVCKGAMVPDLIAYIASIDFVMADVDR